MILVDTSIWIKHWKKHNSELAKLLELDRVATHPFVVGELACGSIPSPRDKSLRYFSKLKKVNIECVDDVMFFIDRYKLYSRGVGLVDVSLLASVFITPGAKLWTADKKLKELAIELDVAYQLVS